MTDAEPDFDPENRRVAAYEEWVSTVRDPARESSEGIRTLMTANRAASAAYEIAPLPDGRFAIRLSCEYESGEISGVWVPWTPLPTRSSCLEYFVETALRHFNQERTFQTCVAAQREGRRQMRELLSGGLFGFIEPDPVT